MNLFKQKQQMLETEFQKALEAKRKTRQIVGNLPFEEKYKMLVAMQRRSAAILETRGVKRIVWPDLE